MIHESTFEALPLFSSCRDSRITSIKETSRVDGHTAGLVVTTGGKSD